MVMAVELIVSKIVRGQRSKGSGHNETDYNSLKCNFGLYIQLNLNVYEMVCWGLRSPSASSGEYKWLCHPGQSWRRQRCAPWRRARWVVCLRAVMNSLFSWNIHARHAGVAYFSPRDSCDSQQLDETTWNAGVRRKAGIHAVLYFVGLRSQRHCRPFWLHQATPPHQMLKIWTVWISFATRLQ